MEQKNIAQMAMVNLVTQVNTRLYTLSIPMGSPWSEVDAVIEDFKSTLVEMQRIAVDRETATQQNVPEIREMDLQAFADDVASAEVVQSLH